MPANARTGMSAFFQGKAGTAAFRRVFRVVDLARGAGTGVVCSVSSTWPSSRQTSSVVWYLFSRSFCMQRRMIALSAAGVCGFRSSGWGGSSDWCLKARAKGVSAENGRRPVTISKRMTPKE